MLHLLFHSFTYMHKKTSTRESYNKVKSQHECHINDTLSIVYIYIYIYGGRTSEMRMSKERITKKRKVNVAFFFRHAFLTCSI
jgi:hypothetical protein